MHCKLHVLNDLCKLLNDVRRNSYVHTVRYSSTDDLISTDSQTQDSACMHECSGFRSAAARRCCSEINHTSDPGTRSCAFSVSFLLSFSEAAHDGPVRNHIHNRTVVCGLRESPPRAHCTCTSLHFHCRTLAVHIYIQLFGRGPARAHPPVDLGCTNTCCTLSP